MISAAKRLYNRYLCPGLALGSLRGCRTILELGCSKKSMVFLAGIHNRAKVTGVDIFQPYVDEMAVHYHKCICADIARIEIEGTYDAVVCMDVLEHLPKNEGLKVLDKMKRWGKRGIITTPNGFQPNPPIDSNPFQVHLSGWTVDDFRARGFKVRGLSGWKVLRTTGAELRFTKPYLLWALISVMTIPFFYWLPQYSWHLLATYTRQGEQDTRPDTL